MNRTLYGDLKARDFMAAIMLMALVAGLFAGLTPEAQALVGTHNYSGTWSGTYTGDPVNGTFQFTVNFNEGTVTGWFTGDAEGDINGTVSDGKLEATGTALGGTVNWTGTVSPGGNSISGTWEFITPGIGSGTWSGTKEGGPSREVPGLPPEAAIADHSGQVPVNFPLKVTPDTTAFVFQNFTLLTNSTRETDLTLTVDPQVGVQFILLNLEPAQSLALDINVTIVPSSEVPSHNQSIGVYLDVEPNATDVGVSSTLGLYINQTRLEAELGEPIDVSELSWAYWNQTEWVELESYINDDGYLVAETTHFSQWTVIPEFPIMGILLAFLIVTTSITVLSKRLTQKNTKPEETS